MNFLFTFDSAINSFTLAEFEMFCQDLDVYSFAYSANDNDEDAEFPPNFIMVYADTEDTDLLASISNKYEQLIAQDPSVIKPADYSKGKLQ